MSPAAAGARRRIVAIAGTELRRLFRDRANIFFVLVFPMLLILILGTVFGGGFTPRLGVVVPRGDALADDFVAALERGDDVDVQRYASAGDLRSAVERGSARAGVVLPYDYSDQLAAGETVEIGFVTRPDGLGAELQTVVQAAIGDQAVVQAAQFGVAHSSGGFDDELAAARAAQRSTEPVAVRTVTVGEELFPEEVGQFGVGATQQLLLFMFVNGLAGATALILSRELGVARRMLSTPSSAAVIMAGEAAGRFVTVAFQGFYIILGTMLLFGVDWGNPFGALVLMLVFAAVATGAALLMGALFRNEQQASGVGVVAGLGLAALGGCMAPLEIFSPTMRKVAHLTPHAWALDGFNELIRHHGTVLDILPELGVLTAMAVVLLTLGTRRFRRTITT
jgi:ABC-2 type transport system permease protein